MADEDKLADQGTAGEEGMRAAAGPAFLQELKEDPRAVQSDTLPAESVKPERVNAIGPQVPGRRNGLSLTPSRLSAISWSIRRSRVSGRLAPLTWRTACLR